MYLSSVGCCGSVSAYILADPSQGVILPMFFSSVAARWGASVGLAALISCCCNIECVSAEVGALFWVIRLV